jgi:hypothetical protein
LKRNGWLATTWGGFSHPLALGHPQGLKKKKIKKKKKKEIGP